MKKTMINLTFTAILGAFSLTVIGCGGGSDSPAPQAITYTGSTSEAELSAATSKEIAGQAYTGGEAGNALGTFSSALQTSEPEAPTEPRNLILTSALDRAARRAEPAQTQGVEAENRAMTTISRSEDGVCGGTASYSLSFNDTSLAFNGSISFSTYCDEEGTTLNGSLNFSGHVDSPGADPGLADYSMVISQLSVTNGPDSFGASGSMTATVNGLTTTVSLDLFIRDNLNNGAVYWVHDYVLVVTADTLGTYEDFIVSGRFYAPQHGYVVLSTPVPMRVYTGADCPTTEGRIKFAGRNNTSAILEVDTIGICQYKLSIDETGDGQIDEIQTGNWADL